MGLDAVIVVLELAFDSAGLWNIITIINEKGVWNLKGFTPTGAALWTLSAIEAAIIIVIVVLVARESANDPFCEGCEI